MSDSSYLLLIDDDDAQNFLSNRSLGKLGASVPIVSVENGQAALEMINRRGAPKFAFLDLRMPVLDGFGFLDKLSAIESLAELCVVVMSSSSRDEDRTRAESYRCVVRYIDKPLTPESVALLRSSVAAFDCCFEPQ